MTRPRHEHQIKLANYTHNGCNTFEDALFDVLYRRGALDLSWLSDDLIAEVRHRMISKEWSRHKFRREQRKQALASLVKQKGEAA